MDISDVITLTVQAASSVLRFRAVAFGSFAFIEFKSFTNTIKITIRRLARDNHFTDDMPLACVVEFTGTAAFRAAKKWNSIAMKPHHVDCDWFRSSITTLISGVVFEIGHQAHHQLQTAPNPFDLGGEYLDPQGDEDNWNDNEAPSSAGLLQTPPAKAVRPGPSGTSRLVDNTPASYYYGLEPAEDRITGAVQLAQQPMLPRHQMTEGWRAIGRYAADPHSYAAAAECEGAVAALVGQGQPRDGGSSLGSPASSGPVEMNSDEENDDDDEDRDQHDDHDDDPRDHEEHNDDDHDDINNDSNGGEGGEDGGEEEEEQDPSEAESEVRMPVAKRQRVSGSLPSPTVMPSRSSSPDGHAGGPSNGGSESPSPGTNGHARNGVPWTREEERLLVQLRDDGEDWAAIYRRLNRGSRAACKNKYYSLQDKRRARGARNQVSGSPSGKGAQQVQRMPRV